MALTNITLKVPAGVAAAMVPANCNFTPGATCRIRLTYSPTQVEQVSGTVGLMAAGYSNPVASVSYSGSSTNARVVADRQVSSEGFDFGEVVVGQRSATQVVTLTNTGPVSVDVSYYVLAPASTTAATWTKGGTCTGTLVPGASCTHTLSVVPNEVGNLSGLFSFYADPGFGWYAPFSVRGVQ